MSLPSLNLRKTNQLAWAFAIACALVVFGPSLARAAGAGGTMPWDSNMQKISQSFTGTLAYTIAIIGVVAAGMTLIFSQELPWFLRAVCYVVLAASFMCGANAFASTMGWTGAVV